MLVKILDVLWKILVGAFAVACLAMMTIVIADFFGVDVFSDNWVRYVIGMAAIDMLVLAVLLFSMITIDCASTLIDRWCNDDDECHISIMSGASSAIHTNKR